MMMIDILLYIIFIFVIQSYETLRCYSCIEEHQCTNITDGHDRNDACMITVNEYGLINRGMISAHICRSSSSQYCCYEDLCNGLSSIPLPALTNLSCAVSNCLIDDNRCNHSMIYRSNAMESCVRIHRGEYVQKSYQIGCFPRNRTIISFTNESISESLSCCHSSACNQQNLPLNIVPIRCYICDSRINGFEGCDILNTSNIHVYQSESSSRSESCAMILGLAGIDTITGKQYPTFIIRTFIANCVNESLGNITYGGASFQGRIDCCSTSLCNTSPLYTNVTLNIIIIANDYDPMNLIVFIIFACLGGIFMLIGLFLSIYRYRLSRSFYQHIEINNRSKFY